IERLRPGMLSSDAIYAAELAWPEFGRMTFARRDGGPDRIDISARLAFTVTGPKHLTAYENFHARVCFRFLTVRLLSARCRLALSRRHPADRLHLPQPRTLPRRFVGGGSCRTGKSRPGASLHFLRCRSQRRHLEND